MTFEAEKRAGSSSRDAMLTSTRLGDDPTLAHSHGEKRLPESVVDFVGSCMRQVLTLEENPASPACGRQARGFVRRCWPSDVVSEQTIESSAKSRIIAHVQVCTFECFNWLDERLGHESAAEFPEVAACIRIAPGDSGCHRVSTSFIAATSALSLSGSFNPGELSTPDDTSIPAGSTRPIASPTFSGVKPPARITGRLRATVEARLQSTSLPVPPRRTRSCTSSSTRVSSGHASIDSSLASSSAMAFRTGRAIAMAYETDSSPCN